MNLIWSEGFKRSFKKLIKKNPQLKIKIFDELRLLAEVLLFPHSNPIN